MKKILSLFLSLALFIGAMPIFALADDGFSISEDLTALSGIEEKLQDPDQNLTYGFGLSTVKGTAGTVTLSYTDANNTDKAFTLTRFPNLTNGVIDENHTDVNTSTTDGNAPLYVDADGNALEGVWLDITVSFIKTASVDSLLVAGCAPGQPHFNNQEYEVYAGNSIDSLYSAENKKLTYVNSTSSNGQYIEFDAPVSAQFVGIRITKAVIPEGVPESVRKYAVPRLREIAVFGEITYTEAELIDSAKRAQEYIAKLKTDAHINYGYNKAEGKSKGVMFPKGCEEGELMSYGSIKSYTTDNDLSDGDVSTNADVNVYSPNGYVRFLKDGVFRENTYGDIIVCLKNPSVIDSILIGQRVDNIKLRSRRYDLYMSENLSDLFDEENRYAEYENTKGSVQQTFAFPEGVDASFVGMRVYEAVTLPEYNLGDDNSYIRLNEFAVFGREKINQVSVSAASSPIEVINEEETVIEGTPVSYEIPLVEDGYTFSKCLVNGEETDVEIIPRSNKACLKTAIDVDTNIVFEYAPNSENLSSDIFKVIDNRVIVGTKKLLVYELRGGFDQYAPSISVDWEGEYAPDYFTVSGDMRLKLKVTENLVKSYEVDRSGDPVDEGESAVPISFLRLKPPFREKLISFAIWMKTER